MERTELIVKGERLTSVWPMFVTVIVCPALVTPSVVSGKVSAVAETCKYPEAYPVPLIGTVNGLLLAFETIDRFAVCNPLAVGVNARSNVQVPPAGMLIAQLSVSENCVAGANVNELIATGELPIFRSSSGTEVPKTVELTPTASPEVL